MKLVKVKKTTKWDDIKIHPKTNLFSPKSVFKTFSSRCGDKEFYLIYLLIIFKSKEPKDVSLKLVVQTLS